MGNFRLEFPRAGDVLDLDAQCASKMLINGTSVVGQTPAERELEANPELGCFHVVGHWIVPSVRTGDKISLSIPSGNLTGTVTSVTVNKDGGQTAITAGLWSGRSGGVEGGLSAFISFSVAGVTEVSGTFGRHTSMAAYRAAQAAHRARLVRCEADETGQDWPMGLTPLGERLAREDGRQFVGGGIHAPSEMVSFGGSDSEISVGQWADTVEARQAKAMRSSRIAKAIAMGAHIPQNAVDVVFVHPPQGGRTSWSFVI